ncbi:hypothetical protein GLOIN_2v1844710 [Rhizophagus irregularis DAOM 181602=DAOM 197198]|uniref:Serine-threonine/tyrosine-protein kinase catalytic domain-containing protein n=1 Tax=Rhizophagus irregularis (strain DAOM 181602 / DAOM 197198 / MUCL 43194) TaxID=747089 RepID=A0A2P4PJ85_RHIID|nr:hypothetical protein GLOIN_2v1844710 [Rhizophagus irregularis DAOM 181602=DAOM 197198]POG65452.1 hypothetical protein GLOIN_2v1844710 [Rhizophagus irregularis DAOM 181602=DAOM 197198]|eukprot:XP_025172318.1 hypothetical protein GLOIN_2v1844710 [Rhizophagus irregularis DAOM 181602=DAOM 197198]
MKKCWDSDSSKRPVIKEIRKTIGMWVHKIKDIDQFCEAETTRLKLIEKRKLGPEYAVKTHPGAIYTSRLLNFLISSSSSISSSSTTSFNTKQEYISKEFEYDINDAKWSSSLDSKSPTKQVFGWEGLSVEENMNIDEFYQDVVKEIINNNFIICSINRKKFLTAKAPILFLKYIIKNHIPNYTKFTLTIN